MTDIWFWQRIISPHMAGLATSLSQMGCQVTYIAEQEMTADRAELGWQVPKLDGVRLCFAQEKGNVQQLLQEASTSSVHICQSLRSNGHVAYAQTLLAERRLRQWVVMETVNDVGFLGPLKRLEYSRLIHTRRKWIEGILAIGHATTKWVVARGMPKEAVFPFAYFLPEIHVVTEPPLPQSNVFRFIFVGRLDENKRLRSLISELASLQRHEFELIVVGAGPLESVLRTEAEVTLPGRVRWMGRLPSSDVPAVIAQADCLVLPSRYDGWGAVVSEALLTGTPAICSDTCGVAEVVRASSVGGVFDNGNNHSLRALLERALIDGRILTSKRSNVIEWATALGAGAGANYLHDILAYSEGMLEKPPSPPWLVHAD